MSKHNIVQGEFIVKSPKLTLLSALELMIDAEEKASRAQLSTYVLDALDEWEQELKINQNL